MPNAYATVTTKKFLDAAGLTYFSRKLNNYPTNDVIYAVIEGTQDALDEKITIVERSSASSFPQEGEDKTFYVDTTANAIYRWNGTAYVILNPDPAAITNASIDLLFT